MTLENVFPGGGNIPLGNTLLASIWNHRRDVSRNIGVPRKRTTRPEGSVEAFPQSVNLRTIFLIDLKREWVG